MNYYIEGHLYASDDLLSEFSGGEKKEIQLFDGFYIYDDGEWLNVFKSPLRNYRKYNFEFYFNGEKINHLGENLRNIKTLLQDNIELELGFYCLLKDISLISWIRTDMKEYKKTDKVFHKINYLINHDYCRDYHRQNNKIIEKKSNDYCGYKFRLSNSTVTPIGNSRINIDNFNIDNFTQKTNKKINLDLNNKEILTQLNYYNNGLFLENNGFMSDAFNYFYKIIEVEEKKIGNINSVKKSDLEKNIELFLNKIKQKKDDFINLDILYEIKNNLKNENSKQIRGKIFKKYDLTGDLKDFQNLGSIRGKFSHSGEIDYINEKNFRKGKKSAFEIILKKITTPSQTSQK